MGSALLFLTFVVVGYLSGSLCSAIIVSRLFGLPNPTLEGSRNPGATNVLRLAGKKYAAYVLVGDMLKGFLPVFIAKLCGAGPTLLGFTCLAAVFGHMYPVFFGFKGGKGVATAIGSFIGLQFIMGAVVIGIWLLVANFSRYASLASIIALLVAPLLAIASTQSLDTFPPIFFIAVLVLYKHRYNINRLIDGEEPKIRFTGQLSDVTDDLLAESRKIVLEESELEKPVASLDNDVKEKKSRKPKAVVKKTSSAKANKEPKAEPAPAKPKKTQVKKTVESAVTKQTSKKKPT